MASGAITAHEEKLLNILWGPNLYEVPKYQRNYAWDSEQTSELWRDVLRTAQGTESYFLGSMVFVETDTSVVFEILDGQQRFASLSLMLAAVRDELKDRKDGSAYLKNIQDTLTTMDLSGRFGHKETTRLHLNERDLSYFEGIVGLGSISTPKYSSHRLIKKAYDYYRTQVAELVDQKGQDLEALWTTFVEAFSERLYVIRIDVGDIVNAQMVFEALNSAGLDLTVADLIKNYILREVPQSSRDAAYKSWTAIADLVEDDAALTSFIRTYWNSAHEFARKDQLYKKLRDRVSKPPLSSGQVDVSAFIKEMQQESQEWTTLQNAGLAGPAVKIEPINQDLQDLRIMGASLVNVPLLALRSQFRADLTSFGKAVRWLRDFHVRHTIVGKRAANEIEEPYSQWAIRLRAGKMTLDELYDRLVRLSPRDGEFEENFRALKIKNARVARLLLARINDAADPSNNITQTVATGGRVNLEHIVPQDPTKWQPFLDAEKMEHEEIVSNIGNLTILVGPKNMEISNKVFADKQVQAYAQGENIAPINSKLAIWPQFGAAELKERQEWLAKYALTVWPLKNG